MKVNILYEFKQGPWGGGNQFLKALRDYFYDMGIYTESPKKADAILVNSHHQLGRAVKLKAENPNLIIVHRIDGPLYDVRGHDLAGDKVIYEFNRRIADGTIFQSEWSRRRNRYHGMDEAPYETTILNAPDEDIFNCSGAESFDGEPIRIIATSWSDNMRKGFDVYGYLDEELDFDRFKFTFVGNSPISYENINWIDPVPSKAIAEFLKNHDIFITASKNDPCSNALIEALHCGLPAVVRDHGGHPEIVGDGGELFENHSDVIPALEAITQEYSTYKSNIDVPSMKESGDCYAKFIESIVDDVSNDRYKPKVISLGERIVYLIRLNAQMAKRRILNTINR